MQYKKTIYLCASTFLGILLSYIVHAAVEIMYLNHALASGQSVKWYSHFGLGSCALPPYIQYGLLAAGIVGGYWLGRWWWRIVYIEKRHWRCKIKKEQ
jgi:hypothetical protein